MSLRRLYILTPLPKKSPSICLEYAELHILQGNFLNASYIKDCLNIIPKQHGWMMIQLLLLVIIMVLYLAVFARHLNEWGLFYS